ncbi:hypothetical protein GH714_020070 [Hevea brasiliensis]|uniref:Uncharacterized protein n=1 Tax=Hevea brasiliensis TaxID=3981 RepID=A0A6A6LI05_HEVBR|nr:hypothetical protein GH714_020070 [Hevea brasiliensis]
MFFHPFARFLRREVVPRHDIACKIKELNERLDDIAKEKDRYNFSFRKSTEQLERQITASVIDVAEVKGRENDKNEIINKLLTELVLRWSILVFLIFGFGHDRRFIEVRIDHVSEVDGGGRAAALEKTSSLGSVERHEDTQIVKIAADNPMVLSPSCRHGGEKDGYLFPEFNDLVEEFDFTASYSGISTKPRYTYVARGNYKSISKCGK